MQRILIIEDDEFNARMLSRVVEKAGFDYICCETVPDDVLLESVVAVISDISLPKVDGIMHIEKIAGWKKHLPVIVISGMDSTTLESTHSLLRLMGVNLLGMFRKPFNKQELTDLIKSI